MDLAKRGSPLFRIVTIGDSSVGKTSFINQLTQSGFDANEPATIGANFILYVEEIDAIRLEMQIWDTAGQERFRTLGPIYYRNSAAAIAVFDLTRSESFDSLSSWIAAFVEIAGNKAEIMVLGNKTDLKDEIKVDETDARTWAESRGYSYFQTSALTGDGITEAMHDLGMRLCKRKIGDVEKMQTTDLNRRDGNTETTCAC